MGNPTIQILLSSYNGEQYIREQIDSILRQESVDIRLKIRDDGSTDGTRIILSEYENLPNCVVEYGNNIGAKNSFLWLIENSDEYEYYAFSDQDDVWEPDKLISAYNLLIKENATLYHGLAGKVDKYLNPLPNHDFVPRDSFGASLLSSATGCTMLFTHQLMSALKQYSPQNISMHDAWVYRVSYALGYKVYYDRNSHMKYRQHERNVSGGQMSFFQKYKKIKKNKGLRYNVAEDLCKGYYNNMPDENKKILRAFLSYRKSLLGKIKVLFSRDYNQYKWQTNLQNKILFLLNLV